MGIYKTNTKSALDSLLGHIEGSGPFTSMIVVEENSTDMKRYLRRRKERDSLVVSIAIQATSQSSALFEIVDGVHRNPKTRVRSYVLDTSVFTKQYNKWLKVKSLKSFQNELFHLRSPLIAAFHIAELIGIRDIYLHKIDLSDTQKLTANMVRKVATTLTANLHDDFNSLDSKSTENDEERAKNDTANQRKEEDEKPEALPITVRGLYKPSQVFENYHITFDFEKASTCAVVGNSGMLLNDEFGEYIDSHDCVVRFNAAPTEGYEKHVGSRSDFRFINYAIQMGKTPSYVETENEWLTTVRDERLILKSVSRKAQKSVVVLAGVYNEIYLMSEQARAAIQNVSLRYGIKNPSMGFVGTITMIKLFPKVRLFGFGFHGEDDLSQRHYWETFDDTETKGGHNWDREKRMIEMFHDKNVLEIYSKS